jgi:zinc protease
MAQKFQLKNGLEVLLVESRKSPVISIQMWVRTGSADEGRGEEGISHFIEHLVFKGTRQFGVGEIAAVVEGSGGELNAYTSFDQTVFYVTISKQFFQTGLTVISEMMGFPNFDPMEIDNEREVVIEEIKRGQDSLGRQASQLLFSTAYKKSAYRVPVIGYDRNIRKVSAKKIRSFYESRYTPPNMFLVVTGDFERKTARAQIEKIFGELRRTPLKRVKRKKEPKQTSPRLAVQATNFEQSIGYCAWKIPGAGHRDIPALDVLALILGQGDSSRLTKRLRIQEPLVNSIGTGNYLPLEGGLFMLSFGFEKEKFARATSAIQEEFEIFLKEGPTPEEVKKAIINLESGELYSMETVDGLARRYGAVEFQFRDLKAFDRYFKVLKALTPADIQKAAQKYLVPETLSVTITSQGDTQELKQKAALWIKEMQRARKVKSKVTASKKGLKIAALKMKPGAGKAPEIEVASLKSGARVLFRPSSETAVVSVRAAVLGGLRYEPKGKNGLVELLSRVWMGGTETRTETQLFDEIDHIAASLSPVVGRNSVGLGFDALSAFEKEGADLFADVLAKPLFSDTVVEREKELQIQQMKHKKDNPGQIVFHQFLKKMFEGHPYALEQLGHPEELKSVTSSDLKDYWKRVFDPRGWHFSICGKIDRDLWLNQLDKALAGGSAGRKESPSLELKPLSQSVTTFQKLEKEQSHVVLGYRSFPMTDERRHVLYVIQSILAGQGGRLFIELRDKESLAYSVSPTRLEGLEGGYFGAYIGCSPEKTKKAIHMMKIEFEKLMTTPVSQEELARAKRYIIGRHDIELQRTSAIATGLLYEDLYGLDFNEIFKYTEVIESITPEMVRSVSTEVFGGPSVLSIVGPSDI